MRNGRIHIVAFLSQFVIGILIIGMIVQWLCKDKDVMGRNHKNTAAFSNGEQQGFDTNAGAAHRRHKNKH